MPAFLLDGPRGEHLRPMAAPPPALEPEPPALHVVADAGGVVGVFLSAAAARAVAAANPDVPLIEHVFPLDPGAPSDVVYVVPYRDINAVAFASNSRAACAERQRALRHVALAVDDDLDYWRCEVGRVIPAAEGRLREMRDVARLLADPEALRAAQADADAKTALLFSRDEGPLQRLARRHERVSILDHVVPAPEAPERAAP